MIFIMLEIVLQDYMPMTRASFCHTKKLKKMHLFQTKVAKSCIYAQTL